MNKPEQKSGPSGLSEDLNHSVTTSASHCSSDLAMTRPEPENLVIKNSVIGTPEKETPENPAASTSISGDTKTTSAAISGNSVQNTGPANASAGKNPARPDPTRYGDWEKNGRCIDF